MVSSSKLSNPSRRLPGAGRRVVRRVAAVVLAGGLAGCGGGLRKFPLKDPLWVDQDERPFVGDPEELEYFSPFYWDGANQAVFRPISRFFAVDPAGESVNVNAVDEVADSSWFTNRISRSAMTPEEVAAGACAGHAPIDPSGPWTVVGAKPNGANPGFLIKAQDDRRYLLKFDGVVQGARPTLADVIGSKLYFAAGYTTPCNAVTFFDRGILRISPEAKSETPSGEKVPMTDEDLDKVFAKATRLQDGRFRASASLFLDGKPIGPFTYEGKRSDDPNDVIAHEDRRDLRGMYVLAAWLNHFDSREQNTLNTWQKVDDERGYIRHNMIDFGDCLGSIWEPPMMGRRIGNAYYLDFGYVLEDLATFGLIERPWEPSQARFGKSGPVWGYYDVERFDPDDYRPGYPNPAFIRRSEADSAWMARMVAKLTGDHVRAAIREAKLNDAFLEKELERIMMGRHEKILRRFLSRLSPLSHPTLSQYGRGGARLCLRDLAVFSGVADRESRTYAVAAYVTGALTRVRGATVDVADDDRVCTSLPVAPGASSARPRYVIVDVTARSAESGSVAPARVHLYHLGGTSYRVVGLERPDDDSPPG